MPITNRITYSASLSEILSAEIALRPRPRPQPLKQETWSGHGPDVQIEQSHTGQASRGLRFHGHELEHVVPSGRGRMIESGWTSLEKMGLRRVAFIWV